MHSRKLSRRFLGQSLCTETSNASLKSGPAVAPEHPSNREAAASHLPSLAIPFPLSTRKSPVPDTETAVAAKSLSATTELQNPSLQALRRSCQQNQPYLTKAETAWLYMASLCLSLLLWNWAFFGKSLSGQHQLLCFPLDVKLSSAACRSSHSSGCCSSYSLSLPWVSCRIHSPAPRGAPHPQDGALSMG